MAKILDWTPEARAASNPHQKLVFFELDQGTEHLLPITVQFLYHTNLARNLDYDSAPRPVQWSGSNGYNAFNQNNSMMLGEAGIYNGLLANNIPRGTMAIRLIYNNGYSSYNLEVIDGDVVNVSPNGVISWSHRNRSWLSGRDFSLGVKNGVPVAIETFQPNLLNVNDACKCKNTSLYTQPAKCNFGSVVTTSCGCSAVYDADGGSGEYFPKKVSQPIEVCYTQNCPDSGCNSYLYSSITQKGGVSRGRL